RGPVLACRFLGRLGARNLLRPLLVGISLFACGCELVADIRDVVPADAGADACGASCGGGGAGGQSPGPVTLDPSSTENRGMAIAGDGTVVWASQGLTKVLSEAPADKAPSGSWASPASFAPLDVFVDGASIYFSNTDGIPMRAALGSKAAPLPLLPLPPT